MESVYAEELPGLGRFTLRRLDPAADADLIHRWVTEPRAEFWGMTDHTRDDVREIYEFVEGLDTHHAYMMSLDHRPIGIFQTYEPAADPIGEHYPVRAGDHGIHLFLARADPVVPGFTGAVAGALVRYVFRVPERKRIIVEPDARNERALRRWKRLGFVFGERVELPHKTAQLAFLDR
jgi:RimJ/RimL family protein N-acetyltransferase